MTASGSGEHPGRPISSPDSPKHPETAKLAPISRGTSSRLPRAAIEPLATDQEKPASCRFRRRSFDVTVILAIPPSPLLDEDSAMKLNAYLHFNGKCAEAFRFYEKVFSGKIAMTMTYGESPMASQTPPEFKNAVMHTRLLIGDDVLMGADSPPDRFIPGQGYSLAINVTDTAEAERIYKALSEKGTVQMPLQETFWAKSFAMFVDQYGIPWMINCEKPR
jgi:PhnB protein